jgi:hypothetical protein
LNYDLELRSAHFSGEKVKAIAVVHRFLKTERQPRLSVKTLVALFLNIQSKYL